MPTSARWEVANSLQITVKTVQSAGSMRRPQASFEAQPRIARLLAPKMGIDPYTETGSACVCARSFSQNRCTLPGGQSRHLRSRGGDIDRDRTFDALAFF